MARRWIENRDGTVIAHIEDADGRTREEVMNRLSFEQAQKEVDGFVEGGQFLRWPADSKENE